MKQYRDRSVGDGKKRPITGVDYTTAGNFVGFDFVNAWTMKLPGTSIMRR